MKVAVMASGRGSNFQAIIDSSERGEMPNTQIVHLIADNKDAYAIQRASKHNIDYTVIESKKYSREDFEIRTLKVLQNKKVDVIVLAGFMRILTSKFINSYKNKIINIHPSILPSYGGKGMFGSKIHNKVIENNETETGITIHYVSNQYDSGEIIFQKKISIEDNETARSIEEKIHILEYEYYPKVIQSLLIK